MATDKKLFAAFSRRDLLKSLAGVPILGAVWAAGIDTTKKSKLEKDFWLEKLNIKASAPPASGPMSGNPLRIGLIGFGIRGEQLMRAMGFATQEWMESMAKSAQEDPNDKRLEDFLAQENLNVKLTAFCDIFDVRAEKALRSFNTESNPCKRYENYLDLIHSGEVDAIIIATPDHWYAPMAQAAIEAGVNAYVEKPMTHTVSETYLLREAVRKNPGAILAVGHQHRQTLSFLTAQDAIAKNTLGHISLVVTNTNRNDDNGAWQYEIHPEASPETIDWNAFLGNAPEVPFNTEHFFRWRKWWAYGSGLSGDLLTHDYDRINCVLKMGD